MDSNLFPYLAFHRLPTRGSSIAKLNVKLKKEMIMATTTAKKAPVKKVPAKKATAKKTAPKKAAPKKVAAKKVTGFNFSASAEKAINVYFGIIGQGIDAVKENLETARKGNDKRVKQLEKRGVKLRTELTGRIENIEMPTVEMPEFDNVVEDVKAQITKVQGQVEDVVENVREKLKAA
ncbi:MAG: hypothetical protein ACJA09_001256 [Alcanivorax sp.]